MCVCVCAPTKRAFSPLPSWGGSSLSPAASPLESHCYTDTRKPAVAPRWIRYRSSNSTVTHLDRLDGTDSPQVGKEILIRASSRGAAVSKENNNIIAIAQNDWLWSRKICYFAIPVEPKGPRRVQRVIIWVVIARATLVFRSYLVLYALGKILR